MPLPARNRRKAVAVAGMTIDHTPVEKKTKTVGKPDYVGSGGGGKWKWLLPASVAAAASLGRGRVQDVLSQTGLVHSEKDGWIFERMSAAARRRWSGNEMKDAKDTASSVRPSASVGGTVRYQSQP